MPIVPRREGDKRSEGLFPAGPDIRTHAMHLTPTTVMAFGLMLLLIGLMVEGRRTTWLYIGLIVLALVILWPIFIMLYRGYLKPQFVLRVSALPLFPGYALGLGAWGNSFGIALPLRKRTNGHQNGHELPYPRRAGQGPSNLNQANSRDKSSFANTRRDRTKRA